MAMEADSADLDMEELSAVRQADVVRVGRWALCEVGAVAGLAWECAGAAQAEDVWVHTEEAAADRVQVSARLDVDRDQPCGVRTETDVAHREADTTGSAEDEAHSVANAAENPAGIMGAEIAIDPSEVRKEPQL